MLIGLVTVMSVSASAAGEHTHCICGETHASVGDHDAEVSTTFTTVTNQAELQNAATNGGNVYLANDIELTADITVAGNLNLCLNGYSITPADSLTDSRAITVSSGATVAIVLSIVSILCAGFAFVCYYFDPFKKLANKESDK